MCRKVSYHWENYLVTMFWVVSRYGSYPTSGERKQQGDKNTSTERTVLEKFTFYSRN